jgi:hypothetical protein
MKPRRSRPLPRIDAAAPLAVLATGLALFPGRAAAQAIPEHPSRLTFAPLAFEPPRALDHRVALKNGLVVFIAEDRTLPLVNLALTVRAGRWLEPAGKEGLAALTGLQLRQGGTQGRTAEELDERLEFLAAQVSSGLSDTAGAAGLSCLSDNLDESLALFVEMLREPRFQENRLALAKEQALQEMKKRNTTSRTDSPRRHPSARSPARTCWPSTAASITRPTWWPPCPAPSPGPR